MTDRHAELLRQRALLQEHLAWLDREISAAADKTKTASVSPPVPSPSAPIPAPPAAAPDSVLPSRLSSEPAPGAISRQSAASDPDSFLEQYRASPGSLQNDVRKGCFLYFAAALALLALGVLALYFLISSR